MTQLNTSLADVHYRWYNQEIYQIVLAFDDAIWWIENHIEARKCTKMANDVPGHSLAESSIDMITAISYDWLSNCINQLTDHDNKPCLVVR